MAALSKAPKDEFDSPVERLLVSITNLRKRPTSKGAHFYRTSLRRFQAWSNVFHPRIDREQEQALKLLDKLRKVSGKFRDAAVHLDLLQGIKEIDAREVKRVRKHLKSRRESQRTKLKGLLRDPLLSEVWPRLQLLDEEPQKQLAPTEEFDRMAHRALNAYRAFVRRRRDLTPESLHDYRLACKRSRYTAELAGDTVQAKQLVEAWKHVQDVIGDWHDHLILANLAAKVLGDSVLHSALVGLTQQKYADAVVAVDEIERKLLGDSKVIPKKVPGRAASRSSSRVA
ncbi:MAG TPA: CHAD domain-containing protein [Terriglobales bacterium]|nr:CHAD domain-containing protein [Terriglobales bacterium]